MLNIEYNRIGVIPDAASDGEPGGLCKAGHGWLHLNLSKCVLEAIQLMQALTSVNQYILNISIPTIYTLLN